MTTPNRIEPYILGSWLKWLHDHRLISTDEFRAEVGGLIDKANKAYRKARRERKRREAEEGGESCGA